MIENNPITCVVLITLIIVASLASAGALPIALVFFAGAGLFAMTLNTAFRTVPHPEKQSTFKSGSDVPHNVELNGSPRGNNTSSLISKQHHHNIRGSEKDPGESENPKPS